MFIGNMHMAVHATEQRSSFTIFVDHLEGLVHKPTVDNYFNIDMVKCGMEYETYATVICISQLVKIPVIVTLVSRRHLLPKYISVSSIMEWE